MSSAERYEIAPVSFEYGAVPTALNLQQMQAFRISPGVHKSRIRAGGSVDSLAFMVGRGRPQATFETRDLATIFSQLSPLKGLVVTGDAIFRELERDEEDVWTGGGMTYTSAGGGFVYPNSLSAAIGDTDGAALSCTFLPWWDGTNPPIVAAYSASMASAPPAAFLSQYFLGPIYHNGAEIRGVQQASVEFGLAVSGAPLTPGPYDRSSAITDRNPTFTFQTTKSNANTALFGSGVSTIFSLYFQKGTVNSDRVPFATAQHIKISCASGFIDVTEVGGQAGADATVGVTVNPVGPIAISLASAIP